MPLKTQVEERKKGHFVVRLEGRLDTDTASVCENRLQGVSAGAKVVVLDLAALDYISSMGLRLVLGLRKALHARGGRLLIANPQPAVQKVLDLSEILPKTDVFNSMEGADIFLDAIQRKEAIKDMDVDD